MNSPDLIEALQALAVDKGISIDTLFGALADAFESAYKRLPNSQEYAWVIIDPDSGEIRVMALPSRQCLLPRRLRRGLQMPAMSDATRCQANTPDCGESD